MPNDINFNQDDENDAGDDDLLANLLDEEKAIEDGTNDTVDMEEMNTLKAQLAELEKANAGLLKAKQAETMKRQDSQNRIAQLEGAVGSILSQRQQQGMESVSVSEAADAQAMGIPVHYDDEGNGWIDPNSIASLVSPYEQRINELEAQLQQTSASTSAEAAARRVMEAIVGEDERFGPASGRYRAARQWVENAVLDYTKSNGINRAISSGEALDKAFDPYTRQEFEKNFPGINLVNVVTAQDSAEQFRMALDQIAGTMTPQEMPKDKMDSRFQKVLEKPSALGNQANAKAGQLSILDRVNNISTQDIMDLSDDQIDTLMKTLERS